MMRERERERREREKDFITQPLGFLARESKKSQGP
jgi:hypothetical protein